MHLLSARAVVRVLLVGLLANTASAVETINTVSVGNSGNAPDTRYNRIAVGGVGYTYQMGKYDVTAGQYTGFLNAVARTDTYGLYSSDMDTANQYFGCNIKRSGTSGNYTYSVAPDWANRPVNFVSWGDAARFANWLSNGQPTGAQNASTTENGSYDLSGAITSTQLLAVTRQPNATWVLPTENEWYKAAYFDPNKPMGPGYWDYPTRSNTVPNNGLNPNGTNNANCFGEGYTIGAPYYRTEVGAFASSPGAYGTYDQGGNVWQWNETNLNGSRILRGGSFGMGGYGLRASYRNSTDPTKEDPYIGFRIAGIPEPATLAMLAVAGMGLLRRRRA